MFKDRIDAGRRLAQALAHLKNENPVVLALPRGGVPVGFEVAQALAAPLDIILVRKIGAPFQPELALAAVVDGGHPEFVFNHDLLKLLGLSEDEVRAGAAGELEEIERRRRVYLGDRPRAAIAGATAIVVDDGIATGATMRAALIAARRAQPRRLVLAVPVAPPETLDELKREVDEAVCLETPSDFDAIGRFYWDFSQTSDDEVRDLLARADRLRQGSGAAAPSQ